MRRKSGVGEKTGGERENGRGENREGEEKTEGGRKPVGRSGRKTWREKT